MAVYCRNKSVGIKSYCTDRGYVRIYFKDLVLYVCYISPNISMAQFEGYIDEIMHKATTERTEVILLGDLNSKSPLWGSKIEDAKGKYITEWLSSKNWAVINEGDAPTFIRGDSRSHIDITFSTEKISAKIKNWKVLPEETMSLHQYITFNIDGLVSTNAMERRNASVINKIIFGKQLQISRYKNQNIDVETMRKIIKDAQEQSTKKNGEKRKAQPYWWNTEIETQREKCTNLRRKIKRMRKNRATQQEALRCMENNLKSNRKELSRMIKKAKNESWNNIYEELESDIWGKGYQIVTKALIKQAPFMLDNEEKVKKARSLFPEWEDTWHRNSTVENTTPFSMEELTKAGAKLKPGKAPGLDGITAEAIKEVINLWPELIFENHGNMQS